MMEPVHVLWLALRTETPPRGYWDQTILEDLIAGHVYRPAWIGPVEHHTDPTTIAEGRPAIVVIPGAYQAEHIDRINTILARFSRVVIFVTSDESGHFPWKKLTHPSMRLWVQYQREAHEGVKALPVGWSPRTREIRNAASGIAKDVVWFFAGQVTHPRRVKCVEHLERRHDGVLHKTPGFLKGLEPDEYLRQLAGAKIAPCPSGTHIQDSFRVYEALELGAVPLVDVTANAGPDHAFWERIFRGGTPVPLIESWENLDVAIGGVLTEWPASHNRVTAWWSQYKRRLAAELQADVEWLTGSRFSGPGSRLIVLFATSPIKSHPDTAIADETLDSVLTRPELEYADVVVMCDGVREKQEGYRARYEEYQERLIRRLRTLERVSVRHFDTHSHQAQMAKVSLGDTDRAAMLFVEHDTPLIADWSMLEQLIDCVTTGGADLIRLHHEAMVLEVHQPLMLDQESHDVGGLPLRRTAQWSQRPHVAATGFYRRILETEFDLPKERWMIEDRMFSLVLTAWRQFGLAGWERYKLYMYVPEGDIKRSTHLDGRAGDHKWTDE